MRFLLLLLLLPGAVFAQNSIGLPEIINYPKKTYLAGLQNWDIDQDREGVMYFANNEGLLSFDGRHWKLYPLPNKTIVRSVKVGDDNFIYVGGQDEMGYFSPDLNGDLRYTSLVPGIPAADRSFGDVWDIAFYRKGIFFRTPSRIFSLNKGNFSVYRSRSEWSYMGICNNRLYAHDIAGGLMTMDNASWVPLAAGVFRNNGPITGIVPAGADTLLVSTYKEGIFQLVGDSMAFPLRSADALAIKEERIYACASVAPEWVAMATSNNGVFIINRSGRLVQRFAKEDGIQNNNILSVFPDRAGNLWLGLDNGIDFIAYNSAVKRITPAGTDGAGYTALIHRGRLFAGTSGGLFQVPLEKEPDLSYSKGRFALVPNTKGQTWGLANINNTLLLGHHEGAMEVQENGARLLPGSTEGYWNFIPLSPVFPTPLVAGGHYNGLSFWNYNGQSFSYSATIPGFSESSRFIALDKEENIWISHPYHGVFKASRGTYGNYASRQYTSKEGLPSTLNNHIFKVGNEVVVATEKGIYLYDPAGDRFTPSPFYRKWLKDQSIRYLKEDTEGNIWFIHEKELGVLNLQPGDTSVTYLAELNHKLLSGFEFIYPVNSQNIFIGGERGFFHINYEKYRKNPTALSVLIRSVQLRGKRDSLLFGGYKAGTPAEPKIPHSWRTIHFVYASPVYGQQSILEYSYRLREFDNEWSSWTTAMEKEYTHLPAGRYHFEVKVRNNLGNESAPATFTFSILPPWYKTTWAYAAYILVSCIGIFLLYKWQKKKFVQQQAKYENEQRELQYMHQLEIDRASKELVSLRNEKLQAEIDFKNSELATNAMHLVQKGELLSKVKIQLNQLLKTAENEKTVSEVKKIIRVLGEDDKMDKDWEAFAQHFDKVHTEFITRLKAKYPALTNNELKLCAYLRMNLTSKEIAQLMNISVRGVEISRYRLRKKLNLSTETSLFDFLIELKS